METTANEKMDMPSEEEWDVPVDAEVLCADGICGHSTYVILNPVTNEVTHIVVEHEAFPFVDRLVPMDLVEHTSSTQVVLSCSSDQLAKMEAFTETEFVRPAKEGALRLRMWPYAVAELAALPLEHEHIPPGELAVRRGARVRAIDDEVGRVDEFLIEPDEGHITHLVMREGHLWGKREVAIPISAISHIREDTVFLRLDKAEVEALPTIPIRRRPTASD